jgi:hypothetical protein
VDVARAFGPDRGMFESNFPPDGVSSSYAVLWNAFKRLAAGFSTDEKAKCSAARQDASTVSSRLGGGYRHFRTRQPP